MHPKKPVGRKVADRRVKKRRDLLAASPYSCLVQLPKAVANRNKIAQAFYFCPQLRTNSGGSKRVTYAELRHEISIKF